MNLFGTIRVFALTAAFGTAAPGDMFKDLSSDDFKVREEAQNKVEQWARELSTEAIAPLFEQYKQLKSPEARSRIESILKEQVILKRFGAGPGFVGIRMQDGNVQVNGQVVPAVGVIEVVKDSAAERAGLKIGDHVVGIDKVQFGDDNLGRVAPSLVFSNYVRTKAANDVVDLKLLRNGEILDVKVTLMAMPDKVRQQQMDMNLHDSGTTETEKERYFQRWLLQELRKAEAKK